MNKLWKCQTFRVVGRTPRPIHNVPVRIPDVRQTLQTIITTASNDSRIFVNHRSARAR